MNSDSIETEATDITILMHQKEMDAGEEKTSHLLRKGPMNQLI
jgi:hypothetical protein